MRALFNVNPRQRWRWLKRVAPILACVVIGGYAIIVVLYTSPDPSLNVNGDNNSNADQQHSPPDQSHPSFDRSRLTAVTPMCSGCTSSVSLHTDTVTDELYGHLSHAIINTPLLAIDQITRGVGIRELFWDAGAIVSQDLVEWQRVGKHSVAMVATPVQSFRGAQGSLSKSFASGVLFTFPVLDEDENGIVIGLSEYAFAPAGIARGNDLSGLIRRYYGAVYSIDRKRSFLHLPGCQQGSRSTSIEVDMTYALADASPAAVFEQLPSSAFVSVSLRRTLLVLDDPSSPPYRPRNYHPKSGFNSISYRNDSSGFLDRPDVHLIVRHDLRVGTSPPTSPTAPSLIYYVDASAPLPVREALVAGISWWDQAFQHAGFPPGTFVAMVAPPDFDPYNLSSPRHHYVEFLHRDRRSYSVGMRVVDPRTGRIVRGHARIGSLRLRQDALIAESLLGPFNDSTDAAMSAALSSAIMDAVLQRCKQLGAHEVGHTLGLAHNFAGSTSSTGMNSVMDYPPPLVTLDPQGRLVLNRVSYADGIGAFDKVAINYGYGLHGDDDATLLSLIGEAEDGGYVFLTDADAGVDTGADWRASPWDSGTDPAAGLAHALKVRAAALGRLSERAVPGGQPLSTLQEVLPPVFLWHRYAAEAAAKAVGGVEYTYTVRGDRREQQQLLKPISGDVQRSVLRGLLAALDPAALAVPRTLLPYVLPAAFGYDPMAAGSIGGAADFFGSRAGVVFDRLAAAEAAAGVVLDALFAPARMERVATQSQLDKTLPTLSEVLVTCTKTLILTPTDSPRGGDDGFELESRLVQALLSNAYLRLVNDPRASFLVSAQVRAHVLALAQALEQSIAPAQKNGTLWTCVDSQDCAEQADVFQWSAHRQALAGALRAGKPFIQPLPIPLGPPI